MPALKDDKHEALAQELAKGNSQAVAYINAGFSAKNSRVAASACNRLLKNKPEINARVAELQEIARDQVTTEDFKGDIETLTRMYLEDRLFAKQCGQPGAAVSATNGLAKLYGQHSETLNIKGGLQNRTVIDAGALSDSTMEELLAARRKSQSNAD